MTQCPIQTGNSYVYNFTIVGQRGTLWWHAHISWLRSTLHGPIVILPKLGVPYPFTKPYKEVPIIFGEWWNADPEAVIKQALQTGGGPNVSDAYTFNGLPGPLYNCSAKGIKLHTYITAFYTIYSLNDRGLVKQTVRTHKVTFHYLARKILNKTYSEISSVLSQCLQWISKIFDICCMGLWQMHSS